MTRQYDKLVRDRIPAVVEASGETPATHVVDGAAYRDRLFEKLDEEVAELREDPSVEELADVTEVLAAVQTALDIEDEELARVRTKKRTERGGFDGGVVLDRVE